jgi:hypothetical protein
MICPGLLQLSGLLVGDMKESRNDSPTRDLQMAADRTQPHSAAMLADRVVLQVSNADKFVAERLSCV